MCKESNTKNTTIVKIKFLLSVLYTTTITIDNGRQITFALRNIRFGLFGFSILIECALFLSLWLLILLHSSHLFGFFLFVWKIGCVGVQHGIRYNYSCISFTPFRIYMVFGMVDWFWHIRYAHSEIDEFRCVVCSPMTTSAITV